MKRAWETGSGEYNRMEMLWVIATVFNERKRPFCGRRRPSFRRPQFEKHQACRFVRRRYFPKPGRFDDWLHAYPF